MNGRSEVKLTSFTPFVTDRAYRIQYLDVQHIMMTRLVDRYGRVIGQFYASMIAVPEWPMHAFVEKELERTLRKFCEPIQKSINRHRSKQHHHPS